MGQSDALQRATERLDAAADQLEIFLSGVFADAEGGGSIADGLTSTKFASSAKSANGCLPISTLSEIACGVSRPPTRKCRGGWKR